MTKKTAYNYASEILGEMKHAIVKCGKDTACIEGVQLLTLYRVFQLLRDAEKRDLIIDLIWLLSTQGTMFVVDVAFYARATKKH